MTEMTQAYRDGIEVISPTSRKEWLAERRHDVTASQIAALLDLHPYCTRLQLFLEKSGRKIPDDDLDTAAMRRGRLLEGLAYTLASDLLPGMTLYHNETNQYWRDRNHSIGATPDIIAEDPKKGRGVIQLKSIEPSIYQRTWIGGEPPIWIALQALTEAKLTGAQWAAVGALRVGHGVEFDLTDVPLANNAWATLLEANAKFWELVCAGTAPEPDYRRDGELIAAMQGPSDAGTALDLSTDNELMAALHDREDCKATLAQLEKAVAEYDAQIRFKAGAAEVVTAGDFRITLRSESVKAYSVAARERRPIRIKRIRGEAAAAHD